MKLERLESIPDEVDEKLFRALVTLPIETADAVCDAEFRKLFLEVIAESPNPILAVGDDLDTLRISSFGLLNTLFRHFCPGYRLMVTEAAPDEPVQPRRLWVCKEVE